MAAPPTRINSRILLAACGISSLKYLTFSMLFAMRASSDTDSGVPATGASWIMIGIEIASDRRW